MNKKEISEIKKILVPDNGYLSINNILTAYIDPSKTISYKANRTFGIIPESESSILMEIFKKSLSGTLGKGIREYSFTDKAYDENEFQPIATKLVNSQLKDAEACDEMLSKIVTFANYPSAYYIAIGSFSYSVPAEKKNKDDEVEDTGEIYNFIITAICPVALTDMGLYFNEKDKIIEKKTNTDFVVAKAPSDAFLFPVFSGRTSDVNNVLYYTKTPKKPNTGIITDILGCEFVRTADEEKNIFVSIMSESFEDNLDCETFNSINSKLLNILEENKKETEITTIGLNELKMILKASKVPDNIIEKFEGSYKEKIGSDGEKLTLCNIIDTSKISMTAPDITINAKNEISDKIRTEIINGQKCIVIGLDEPTVVLNGIDINAGN